MPEVFWFPNLKKLKRFGNPCVRVSTNQSMLWRASSHSLQVQDDPPYWTWLLAKMQRFRSTAGETLLQSLWRWLKLTSAGAQVEAAPLFGGLSPASYSGRQSGLSAIYTTESTVKLHNFPSHHRHATPPCVFSTFCVLVNILKRYVKMRDWKKKYLQHLLTF